MGVVDDGLEETANSGRQGRGRRFVDQKVIIQSVLDQISDCHHFQFVLFGEAHEVGQSRHRAVVFHNFADNPGRLEPRQTGQVDRAFGLSRAHQDAAIAGAQRKYVAGGNQILWFGFICNCIENGLSSIGGGNAGANAGGGVHRYRKRSAERRGVVRHHHRDTQLSDALFGERQTDQPTAMGRHKINCFRSDFLGSHAEIAFVLAVFIIHQNDHLTAANIGDRRFDSC